MHGLWNEREARVRSAISVRVGVERHSVVRRNLVCYGINKGTDNGKKFRTKKDPVGFLYSRIEYDAKFNGEYTKAIEKKQELGECGQTTFNMD